MKHDPNSNASQNDNSNHKSNSSPKPKATWQKGQLIYVKAPPYYEKEYPYEISGAGDKMIRANLQHSPKVKKSWSHEEFELLIEMGLVRVVEEKTATKDADSA